MILSRTVAVLALGTVALTGCSQSPRQTPLPTQPPASASGSLEASPDVSAGLESNSPGAAPVPAAAMLQTADVANAPVERADSDLAPHLRPPLPCGTAGPSGGQRTAAATVKVVYPMKIPNGDAVPTVIIEMVMRFRGDGATKYLAELRADLDRCKAADKNGRTWAAGGVGPVSDSLLFTVASPSESPDGVKGTTTIPVIAVRVGEAIVILSDLGWETSGASADVIKTLAPKAVNRVRTGLK